MLKSFHFNSPDELISNTYVFGNEGRGCYIIDLGKFDSRIEKYINEHHNGIIYAIILTHGHFDHINIQSRFPNFESAWNLTNEIANEGVIYFAFNMKINTCEDGHAFIGSHCKCGKTAVNQFSRVVGFLTPKSSYSAPRKREFEARRWFNVID